MPAKREIQIKDLFCMTSGFTYDGNSCLTERLTGKLLQTLYQNFEKTSCPTREFVRKIATLPLAFEPGTRWRYGLSHDVLGGLIEVLSGQKFGEYVKVREASICLYLSRWEAVTTYRYFPEKLYNEIHVREWGSRVSFVPCRLCKVCLSFNKWRYFSGRDKN